MNKEETISGITVKSNLSPELSRIVLNFMGLKSFHEGDHELSYFDNWEHILVGNKDLKRDVYAHTDKEAELHFENIDTFFKYYQEVIQTRELIELLTKKLNTLLNKGE